MVLYNYLNKTKSILKRCNFNITSIDFPTLFPNVSIFFFSLPLFLYFELSVQISGALYNHLFKQPLNILTGSCFCSTLVTLCLTATQCEVGASVSAQLHGDSQTTK